MTVDSRADAQHRSDEIRVFQQELARLEREGILALSVTQRGAVAAHHAGLLSQYAREFDIDHDVQAKRLSLGMRVASFLGALALAASVFFLFYQFWGRISQVAQVATLLTAALSTFVATLWLQRRDASGYFTKLAALVAFVCFVLNLAMLGQIFNITPSDKALLPWAALAFMLAYACDQRLLLVAGILCVIAFVSARAGAWGGVYWIHFGERPENFFPAALALFAWPALVAQQRYGGFAEIYRVFGLLTLLLPMLVLSHWGRGSHLDIDPDIIEGAYQLCGFGFSAAAIWLGARRGWPAVVNTALVMFVVFLYSKFFDWWWDIMPKYLFFLVIGLASVLLILVLRRLRARGLSLSGVLST